MCQRWEAASPDLDRALQFTSVPTLATALPYVTVQAPEGTVLYPFTSASQVHQPGAYILVPRLEPTTM